MDTKSLAEFSLFSSADEAELALIVSRLAMERFDEGARIFAEGDRGEKLYLVTEGLVRISTAVRDGEEALAMMRKGSFFGEMSLIDDQPRSADAFAQEPTVLWSLSRTDFHDLLESDAKLAITVLGAMARTLAIRLREANDQVKAMHLLSMW